MSKFFKLMVVGVLLFYFLIVEVVSKLYSLKNPYIIYFGTNLFLLCPKMRSSKSIFPVG